MTGRYFNGLREATRIRRPSTSRRAARLRELSDGLCGLEPVRAGG